MIKVLIVDDSSVVREYLQGVLSSDPAIHVVGTARDGEEAVRFVDHGRPDVVTIDVEMKGHPASAPGAAPIEPRKQLVAVGASIGGPPVLQAVLSRLPQSFAAPILIVQHIAPGFVTGLADWLRESTGFPVHVAAHGEHPLPGHAYLVPDAHHMGLEGRDRIVLSREEPECGCRPAVSHLFRSVARVHAAGAVGVLLTGMGRDGAQELRLLREAGAVTIAQDEDSCVVHGMPGAAIALGGAAYVLPPEGIAALLQTLIGRR